MLYTLSFDGGEIEQFDATSRDDAIMTALSREDMQEILCNGFFDDMDCDLTQAVRDYRYAPRYGYED